jgi:hypothetical protein
MDDNDTGADIPECILIQYSVKVGDEIYTASRFITEDDDTTLAWQGLKDTANKQANPDLAEYNNARQKAIANLQADQEYFEKQHEAKRVEQALRDAEGMEAQE